MLHASGFTLMELMIVVAIIGLLAAIAVPTFMDYMAKGKGSEAELMLNVIKKRAVAQYQAQASYPIIVEADGSVSEITQSPTPNRPCCQQNYNGKKQCAPDAAAWETPGWNHLGFTIPEAHYFQYGYLGGAGAVGSETGVGKRFIARAQGNLDCDAVDLVYDVRGGADLGSPIVRSVVVNGVD